MPMLYVPQDRLKHEVQLPGLSVGLLLKLPLFITAKRKERRKAKEKTRNYPMRTQLQGFWT